MTERRRRYHSINITSKKIASDLQKAMAGQPLSGPQRRAIFASLGSSAVREFVPRDKMDLLAKCKNIAQQTAPPHLNIPSRPKTKVPLTPAVSKQRRMVVQEIVETELRYVKDLKECVEAYDRGLQASEAGLTLSESQYAAMFSELRTILNINKEFLGELVSRNNEWPSNELIGDIFLKFGKYFLIYSTYVMSFDSTTETIMRLRQMPAFDEFLSKQALIVGQTLSSYRIKPIQRVTKYPLLIKELLKCTPETHEDYERLKEALKLVSSVATKMDTQKKIYEATLVLVHIGDSISGKGSKHSVDLVAISRKLIRQSEIIYGADINPKTKGVLFLFNDALLLAKKKINLRKLLKKSLAPSKPYEMEQMVDLSDIERVAFLPHGNGFTIVIAKKTKHKEWLQCESKAYYIRTDSIEEAKEWVDSISYHKKEHTASKVNSPKQMRRHRSATIALKNIKLKQQRRMSNVRPPKPKPLFAPIRRPLSTSPGGLRPIDPIIPEEAEKEEPTVNTNQNGESSEEKDSKPTVRRPVPPKSSPTHPPPSTPKMASPRGPPRMRRPVPPGATKKLPKIPPQPSGGTPKLKRRNRTRALSYSCPARDLTKLRTEVRRVQKKTRLPPIPQRPPPARVVDDYL